MEEMNMNLEILIAFIHSIICSWSAYH